MPLVIVDDGLVVKLRRADAETVVGIGRREQKAVILQEGRDQLGIFRRRFPEHRLLRIQVEAARQLGQRSILSSCLRCRSTAFDQLGQVLRR